MTSLVVQSMSSFSEHPFWRESYAPGISQLYMEIPHLHTRIKKFLLSCKCVEFVKGFEKLQKVLYIEECKLGEGTKTNTAKKTLNLIKAVKYLFDRSSLLQPAKHEMTLLVAKQVNKIIGYQLFDSGTYRKTYTMASGNGYMYLEPKLIEDAMTRMFALQYNLNWCNYYQIASKFLVEFLRIHPFVNGNGRTARLLLSLLLIEYSFVPMPLYPSFLNRSNSKDIYLTCVTEAQHFDNYMLINALIIESLYNTLHTFCTLLEVE